jgi:hypothetical protein
MGTTAKTIHIQLPPRKPLNTWRRRILEKVLSAAEALEIPLITSPRTGSTYIYDEHDRVCLRIAVYLDGQALMNCDVDNLLEEVMDGLQGRFPGNGSDPERPPRRVIRNDRHVWRVEIEKVEKHHEISAETGGELSISRL